MSEWTCVRTGELQHHGIKGMKWGRRRFQNADGSLTPAGIKRYRDEAGDIERRLNTNKREMTADDYQNAIKKTKSVGEGIDSVRKFNDDGKKLKDPAMERRIRKSTEQMSDKELQQRVQRLNMEDNYTRMMMNREHLQQGEDYVNKMLDVSATVVRGATTALTIALLIKQMKG